MSSLQAESFVEYQQLRLDAMETPTVFSSDSIARVVDARTRGIMNSPVEIIGRTSLAMLLPLFVRVRAIATEVVYRLEPKGTAVQIYSHLDPAAYVWPQEVIRYPCEWTKKELAALEECRTQDQESIVAIPLKSWWDDALTQNTPAMQLKAFLSKVYQVNPYKSEVRLHDTIPSMPALFVLEWFLKGANKVQHDEQVLYSKSSV